MRGARRGGTPHSNVHLLSTTAWNALKLAGMAKIVEMAQMASLKMVASCGHAAYAQRQRDAIYKSSAATASKSILMVNLVEGA